MRKPLVVSLLAAIAASAVAHAGMASTVTFTAPTIVAQQAFTTQTYTADILISDTVKTDILAGYGLDLFLSSTPGNVTNPENLPANLLETNVTITGFSLNTTLADTNPLLVSSTPTAAYVYNNNTGDPAQPLDNVNNSNDITFADPQYLGNYTTSDGSTVANELYNSDTYANTDVASLNQTYALAQVDLTVAAGFGGTVYLVWNVDGVNNDSFAPFYELSGAPATNLDPNFVDGSITFGPEPSSVVLMLLGAAGLVGYRRLRTRRS